MREDNAMGDRAWEARSWLTTKERRHGTHIKGNWKTNEGPPKAPRKHWEQRKMYLGPTQSGGPIRSIQATSESNMGQKWDRGSRRKSDRRPMGRKKTSGDLTKIAQPGTHVKHRQPEARPEAGDASRYQCGRQIGSKHGGAQAMGSRRPEQRHPSWETNGSKQAI